MIIDEVLELLKKSKYKVYQGYARSDNDCVVYTLEPITSDKIKEQWRLKTICISDNFEKAIEMNEKLKDILITFADENASTNILQISLNGGGNLYDDETKTHQIKAFFNMITKYKTKT